MILKKDIFKFMNNAVLGKLMENVRKHSDIKLVTTVRRRYYLVSKPNYHTTKIFTEHLLTIEIKKKKTELRMNKPVYLGLSLLELSKILMHEFNYDYVKPKYGKKQNCVYGYRYFIVYIKTDEIYKDIAEDVETRVDTSNCELECNSIERPLPKGKNIKVTGLMKDELGGKIMRKLVGLRAKRYSYLVDDGNEDKKAKGTKKCVIKRKMFRSNST